MLKTNWRLGAALTTSVLLAPATPAFAQPEPETHAVAAPLDFSGVWETAKMELVVIPEVAGQLTPEAQREADLIAGKINPAEDDPARFCVVKGMPWTMLIRARTYPVEIIQYPDRLFMVFELYDQFRNIRLGGPPKPEGYPPSPNGWSTAKWDGNALLIETRGLSWLNPLGHFRRSEETRISERWTLREDPEFGQVIDIDMLVDDPEAYSTPAHVRQVLKRSAPGVVPGGYNCAISLWNDYVETRRDEMSLSD